MKRHFENIPVDQFDYTLQENRIANYPLSERDASKLLIYRNRHISEDTYRNIDLHLPENSLLIFNDSRVIEARILFQKPTGGTIEIFCLEPDDLCLAIQNALLQKETTLWKCLVGGASKWKKGEILKKKGMKDQKYVTLQARYIEKKAGYFVIEFSWLPGNLSFQELLHIAGLIPLPPYIKREADKQDALRYQTIYASKEGSVAAPTAGLHFTDQIFKKLDKKNIPREFVTLHVGAGTFQPLKTATLGEHEMHEEFIEISRSTIEKLISPGTAGIVAVGTTSLRTIESLFWLGVKIILQKQVSPGFPTVKQWDPYHLDAKSISVRESLQTLLHWLSGQQADKLVTKTQLMISPGYEFKLVNALVTNFHQPQSTLLLLVAALIGEDWKKVYQYATDHDFRFLSYGDGCLLFGSNQ